MSALRPGAALLALALLAAAPLRAEDAARPLGEPALDPPTLHCLGAWWLVAGDDDGDARIDSAWRRIGDAAWRPGPPLTRVERGAQRAEGRLAGAPEVPPGAWLFAGSVLFLDPGADHEWRLTLVDPDGGGAERLLTARTRSEPVVAPDAVRRHVVPGGGGGAGSAVDPFRGLAAAQAAARPGDVFLVHAGIYPAPFTVTVSGEPGRPVVWRAAGDGVAAIDGALAGGGRADRAISASEVHDVWFEGLALRNADYALVGHESARLVVRGCAIDDVESGITATRNERGLVEGWLIADNVLRGPSTWPRSKGIENARGIQITGAGQVVCRNRISGFADAIDTFPSPRCLAIDVHDNEISECTDDGIEMDYSERNTRCFRNRLTNVYQGISLQPVHGGPVYVLRNVLYNVCAEPFKLHNSPSGALIMHNTCVKRGVPLLVSTSDPLHHCVTRNNLFLGGEGPYACAIDAPVEACDFDHDGFGGGPWRQFLKWQGVRYATLDLVRAGAPAQRHAVAVDAASAFASGLAIPDDETRRHAVGADLRLAPGSAAIDAGLPLPGINDGFAGRAPDLGAHELGEPLPHYGPRPPGR